MNHHKVFYAFVAAVSIALAGCGGGGGGGGSGQSTQSTAVTLEGFSGDVDPDGDGTALVIYYLTFNKSVTRNVAVEFSVDGGESFSTCSEDKSAMLGGEGNPTEGTSQLEAGPGGVEHCFAWNTDAPSNLPGQNLNWVILRVRVIGGENVQSGYLTVTNDEDDTSAPELSDLSAVAVQGPQNDTITITFNEAMVAEEAEAVGNYTVQNPAGTVLDLTGVSTATYQPLDRTLSIVLDKTGSPNLQYGKDCVVTAQGVHDLAGCAIEDGEYDELTASVDGDGSAGVADQPVLEVAYFTGTGLPDADEELFLLFSEEVVLKQGRTFSSEDVEFWDGGDTIGSSSPIGIGLSDPYTVRVTLGTSPYFVPASSRINIPDVNDVITDLAGNMPYLPPGAGQSDYVLVIYNDEIPPVVDQISINEIPDCLNGKGPAGGKLLVARKGFEITLKYHDPGSGSGVDTDEIVIRNSNAVKYKGKNVAANTNLMPYLNTLEQTESNARFKVPGKLVFPEGSNRLKGKVSDMLGNVSSMNTLDFDAIVPSDDQRPFETTDNPSQIWNLIFTRDLYTIGISGSAWITVTAVATSNGIADFKEDLILYGLRSESPIVVPGTGGNSNQFMYSQVVDAVKSELADTIFGNSVNIVFTEQNQGALPNGAPQINYKNFTHSQIAIGGDSDVGALGCAFIDRGNMHQDNDVLYKGSHPYNPGTNLGIFTTTIFEVEVNGSPFGLFRTTFDNFIPGRGEPVGEGADDQDILMDIAGTGPPVSGAAALRRDAILLAVQRLARYIAVVSAHEMGHSMGLSVDGAMPNGLYGGDPANFPGSTENHLDLTSIPGLFSYPSVNIMVPGTNFYITNSAGTRFNMLNLAYLKEKVFYNP